MLTPVSSLDMLRAVAVLIVASRASAKVMLSGSIYQPQLEELRGKKGEWFAVAEGG